VRENKVSGILLATNSGAPYLAFFARCGKITAVSRQLLEVSMDLLGYKASRSVIFPHLAKNARYGAPEFVAGKIPETLFSLDVFLNVYGTTGSRALIQHRLFSAACLSREAVE
jgi:hypothetical protein